MCEFCTRFPTDKAFIERHIVSLKAERQRHIKRAEELRQDIEAWEEGLRTASEVEEKRRKRHENEAAESIERLKLAEDGGEDEKLTKE
jgi:hypothetical protein